MTVAPDDFFKLSQSNCPAAFIRALSPLSPTHVSVPVVSERMNSALDTQ